MATSDYEFKKLATYPAAVQDTIDRHAIFWWEVAGTDIGYSTAKVNFRRSMETPNLPAIRRAEQEYFAALKHGQDLTTTVPEWTLARIGIAALGIVLYVVPGVVYIVYRNKKIKQKNQGMKNALDTMDKIIETNKPYLNTPDRQRVV